MLITIIILEDAHIRCAGDRTECSLLNLEALIDTGSSHDVIQVVIESYFIQIIINSRYERKTLTKIDWLGLP